MRSVALPAKADVTRRASGGGLGSRRRPGVLRTVVCVAAAGGFALLAPAARAQTATGFAVDRFDPSERGSEWFALDTLDLRGDARIAAGVVGDFAYRPIVLYNPDGSVAASILRNQYILDVGGSVVLASRVRLGLNLPVAVYEFGHSAVARGVDYVAPSGAGVGDLRLAADVRLLGECGDPVTVAAGAALYLPTGSQSEYTGDGTVRFEPRVLASAQLGWFVASARVGLQVRPHVAAYEATGLGSDLVFGAAAGAKLFGDRVLLGPELFGSTVVDGSQAAFTVRNTPGELLFGAHTLVIQDLRVGAAIGPGLSRGLGEPAFRVVASAEWAPGARPSAPPDRDGDGIPDRTDACPDTPGVKSSQPEANGCPSPTQPASLDRDGDGVPDAEDACPDLPGKKTGDPRTDGCPDTDGDGIPDAVDACPDAPGVASTDPKTNGCPATRDRDRDGIPDAEDACPDAPGSPTGDPKTQGCPMALIQGGQIRTLAPIDFKPNSAELLPSSLPVLEAVRQVLASHPEVRRLRIEGHTDDRGSLANNLIVSKKRARVVLEWLVTNGVAASRLDSQGYGGALPIADNETEEGRRLNRRIALRIVGDEAE